jgi:hypothetical protein
MPDTGRRATGGPRFPRTGVRFLVDDARVPFQVDMKKSAAAGSAA